MVLTRVTVAEEELVRAHVGAAKIVAGDAGQRGERPGEDGHIEALVVWSSQSLLKYE